MPHSPGSPATSASKAGSDDNTTPASNDRMSEAALRKKKNADAQAAFRARRANYIATLEETVTNLEAVVIQLQDSCREAKAEAADLRAENTRLRMQKDEREKFWRALWSTKKTGQPDAPTDDFPLPPYGPGPVHAPGGVVSSIAANHVNHYSDGFATNGDPAATLSNAQYHSSANQDYPQRSPAMGFAGMESSDAETRSQHGESHRTPRYGPYPYAMDGSRDAWQQANGEPPSMEGSASGHSPSFVESPSLTAADLNYSSRFPVTEDQKLPIAPLNGPGYMFPSSRSMSPAASTPTSTSSTSLAPTPFQFTFPDANMTQDRPDFGYHRQPSGSHGPELTLRGGTADIPIAGTGGEALRYRMRAAASSSAPITPYARTENGSHERESDVEGDAPYHYATRARQRRSTTTSRTSRSPSPGRPPICGTLAVIKAQAFGALRRTRTRSKKSSEGAAKAAVEALEARGIGMGIGSATKRQRLQHDDGDDI